MGIAAAEELSGLRCPFPTVVAIKFVLYRSRTSFVGLPGNHGKVIEKILSGNRR